MQLNTHYNQILSMSTFQELEGILLKIPQKSLIVTDIDNVLTVHKDKIIRPNSRSLYDILMTELKMDSHGKTQFINGTEIPFFEYLHSKLIRGIRLELLEKRNVELLKTLREMGHSILALSQGKTGNYGEIPAMEDVRISQLKELGLNFSESFKDISSMTLDISCSYPYPIFKDGVILTAKASKALSLENFLNRIQKNWETLVYIDDRQDWIEEIYNHFRPYMSVIVIWYKNQKFLRECPDSTLAKKQFDFLRTKHIWLNDEEAQKI